MSEPSQENRREDAAEEIGARAARKAKARKEGRTGAWFGLGMFGLIGWAIAVPTLIGVAAGLWLDRVAPSRFSWTLALILAGVVLGCWNAWNWIHTEGRDQ